MLLKRDADEEDLRNAASLEAWSTAEALEKGKLSPSQRAYFMHQLALAANSIAAKIIEENPAKKLKAKPKRTRKPPPGAPKPVVRKRKRPNAPS